ncbi:MAG: hypothetical protein ACK5LP_07185 [Campylobacteraceae bacterium]
MDLEKKINELTIMVEKLSKKNRDLENRLKEQEQKLSEALAQISKIFQRLGWI